MTTDDGVVGFVGLGIMGGRMPANLQKAGQSSSQCGRGLGRQSARSR